MVFLPEAYRPLLFAGVSFHETKAASVQHADGSSTLTCSDGSQLHSSFVLDCTGHARKLVTFDEKFDPGYQAAYGMMIEVESHPFELDTMLFMDWRDDHTKVNFNLPVNLHCSISN